MISINNILKEKINSADVISFDMFDTLVFRIVNSPEVIFDLIGQKYNIYNFKKIRMDAQNKISNILNKKYGYPHANLDEIYDYLSKTTNYNFILDEVKKFEINLEYDSLFLNDDIYNIYKYAKKIKKRVIVISDMYIGADILKKILEKNNLFFDYIYSSADERAAKFNKELYKVVSKKENICYNKILHIGDNYKDDIQIPSQFGIQTYHYIKCNLDKINNIHDNILDKGLYKILYNKENNFWYNLSIEIAGPIYIGLFYWIKSKLDNKNKKFYFVSRDGYNLYNIFKKFNYNNIEYLYISRRSLVLAGITEINDESLSQLPPYTLGQSVGEILDFLCLNKDKIDIYSAGFKSNNDIINTINDIDKFKLIYKNNEKYFLESCRLERESAIKYLNSVNFFDDYSYIFDCGWSGSSQFLLEKMLYASNKKHFIKFYYFGIINNKKSITQLNSKIYECYLCDFYKNYSYHKSIHDNPVIYELFFSAPHESVHHYQNGKIIFENNNIINEKQFITNGIVDYILFSYNYINKYKIIYKKDFIINRLKRLIYSPTLEEAKIIGDLYNIDSFTSQKNTKKYIAYIDKNSFKKNKNCEVYWIQGLLKRNDISEEIKIYYAYQKNITYPENKTLSTYHLENYNYISKYNNWANNCNNIINIDSKYNTLFSIIVPVYNVQNNQLIECIESIINQSYRKFELILVDDNSTFPDTKKILQKYEFYKNIKTIYRNENGNISVATNDGIKIASGDFLVFVDCDDILDKNALLYFAKEIYNNQYLDYIYSDEDKVTNDGKIYHMPFFKPDWSPDLFYSMMYTNHLGVYRTSIVKQLGGLRSEYNGAQDYDLTLRFLNYTSNKKIGHIAKILYHWRERPESISYSMSSKNYAVISAKLAKEDFFKRNNISVNMELIDDLYQHIPVYKILNHPLVSIIIPSKDNYKILIKCLKSIFKITKYKKYEIIIVDNGSSKNNKSKIEFFINQYNNIKYIYEKSEFNYSKMCNAGTKYSNGEFLLFLNDDIEIFQPDWLTRLLGQAQQKHTGAVGAKLFYPFSTDIQHAGIINNIFGPSHSFIKEDDKNIQYFGFNRVITNCIAVTGACLMVSKYKFREAGMFDESLKIAYSDVELCFSLYKHGYYNVQRNDVCLFHYESYSRGLDELDERKMLRLASEKNLLYYKFYDLYKKDPFLNNNLNSYNIYLDFKDFKNNIKIDNKRFNVIKYILLKILSKIPIKKIKDKYLKKYKEHLHLKNERNISIFRPWN